MWVFWNVYGRGTDKITIIVQISRFNVAYTLQIKYNTYNNNVWSYLIYCV